MIVTDILFGFAFVAPVVLSVPFYDEFDSSLFLGNAREDLWGESLEDTPSFSETLSEGPSTLVFPEFVSEEPFSTNYISVDTDDDLLGVSPNPLDWASFAPTEPTDDWRQIFDNEILSDSGVSCSLGKKRDGASCDVPGQPLQPLPSLELPNLFGIGDGSASEFNDADRAKVVAQIESSSNPCHFIPQFNLHTCCDGSLGYGNRHNYFGFPFYVLIRSCNRGTNECSCYISTSPQPPLCSAIPRAD
jgi:hypothetical protein